MSRQSTVLFIDNLAIKIRATHIQTTLQQSQYKEQGLTPSDDVGQTGCDGARQDHGNWDEAGVADILS